MSIAFVPGQIATGTGNLTLTGVTAGNLLVLIESIFRDPSTGAAVATPTDTNGTWAVANADAPPPTFNGGTADIAVGIFYCANANAGTHTVTPGAANTRNSTLLEFSGLATASPLDVEESAKTSDGLFGSQVTGTTGTTAQADELVIIGLAVGAVVGANPQPGWTDPVSGFTTAQSVSNTQSDLGTLHAYKIVNSVGTQSATFTWTTGVDTYAAHANVATLKASGGGGGGTTIDGVGRKLRGFIYSQG